MTRLIDADALKIALYYDVSKGTYGEFMDGSEVSYTNKEILKLIGEQPTIDAVPVRHGKWIWTEDKDDQYGYVYICSVCGFETLGNDDKFCGGCGADMRGEE